jgi:hypothetical protein
VISFISGKNTSITDSLQERKSELLSEWNYSKNSEISPDSIYYKSTKTVWWLCENNHEWQVAIEYRSRGYGKCKTCKSLYFLRPDLYSQLHPTKNNSLLGVETVNEMTLATSQKIVWWLGSCGHEWEMDLRGRVKSGYNCPYCSGQRVLSGFNDIATTHPNLARQWGLQNQHKPTQVSHGSKIEITWTNECGHSWIASPNHRVKLRDDYCQQCQSVIYTQPEILELFDQKLNPQIDLSKLTKSSKELIQWEGICGHVWGQTVSSRINSKLGCIYCSNQKALEGFNDLETVRPHLAKEWDFKKNKKLPTEFTYGSQTKAWWLCEAKNHSWYSLISDRSRGVGCPHCSSLRSKGEKEVYEYVKSLYKDAEHSRRDLLSNRQEIDIYIPSLNIGVEYNGDYWHSEKVFSKRMVSSAKEYHQNKKDTAERNGIVLLFIWESDWLEHKEDLKIKLKDVLLQSHLRTKNLIDDDLVIDEVFKKL